jgi:hypothetical protein
VSTSLKVYLIGFDTTFGTTSITFWHSSTFLNDVLKRKKEALKAMQTVNITHLQAFRASYKVML